MRYIDADKLKRHIRWDFKGQKSWLEECEEIDNIIDRMNEFKPLDRDDGKEPMLEETTSNYHESRADGTGGFKQITSLDWHCAHCGWFVGELYCGYGRWHIQGETSYCASCGQKIDWTLPKEEEKQRYEQRKEEEREEHLKRTGIRLDNMNENRRRKYGKLNEENICK